MKKIFKLFVSILRPIGLLTIVAILGCGVFIIFPGVVTSDFWLIGNVVIGVVASVIAILVAIVELILLVLALVALIFVPALVCAIVLVTVSFFVAIVILLLLSLIGLNASYNDGKFKITNRWFGKTEAKPSVPNQEEAPST